MEKTRVMIPFADPKQKKFLQHLLSKDFKLEFPSGEPEAVLRQKTDILLLFLNDQELPLKQLLKLLKDAANPPELVLLSDFKALDKASFILESFPAELVISPSPQENLAWLKSALLKARETLSLKKQNRFLAKENQAFSGFYSQMLSLLELELMGHLTAIQGFAELLLGQKELKSYSPSLEKILDSAQEIQRLLNNLHSYLEIKTGKLKLQPEKFDLAQMIESCVLDLQRKTEIHWFELDIEPYKIKGDPQRLLEVLKYLLDNALAYSPQGGAIRIRSKSRQNMLELVVEDCGAGIPPECLPQIFDPFYRVPSEFAKKRPGSGLGLTIARSLVRLHGGELKIESREQQGTRLIMLLPQEG